MSYRFFDGMVWPAPSARLDDVEHALRFAPDANVVGVRLVAAEVISAYRDLIAMPARRRARIIRELRKGPGLK